MTERISTERVAQRTAETAALEELPLMQKIEAPPTVVATEVLSVLHLANVVIICSTSEFEYLFTYSANQTDHTNTLPRGKIKLVRITAQDCENGAILIDTNSAAIYFFNLLLGVTQLVRINH